MGLWKMLQGPRKILKKVKFIYEPYKKAKIAYIGKRKRKILRKNGVETIEMVETALAEYGVTYFADYGTLLGIIREHDFIQWDDDMDYGMIVDDDFDWDKFEQHMNRHGLKKIRQFSLTGKITEQTYSYKNSTLAVDFFAKLYDNQRLVSYIYYRMQEYKYQSEMDFHVRKMMYTIVNATKEVRFKGTHVTVPDNAEQYLESAYSKKWRIPDPVCDIYTLGVELEELSILGKGIFD